MNIENKKSANPFFQLKHLPLYFLTGLLCFVGFYIIQLIIWYQYKPLSTLPNELETMTAENYGLEESLILYFDASSFGAIGKPGEDGNYLLQVDTSSDQITAERLPSNGMQHEYHLNGWTSHYAITPLNTLGQQYHLHFAGIPVGTGGHYIVRDEFGNHVAKVTDEYGMDLHDLVITPEGNYLYLAAHITDPYQDSTITCHPDCFNLGQSVVEVTPQGEELYRYHLLDHYTRDDFVMDDMLFQGDMNLYDLTHANSVRLSPDGTELIISVRHTNEVISLDRSNGSLAWRSSDYTFVDDIYNGFSHQHDAQILNNGNLLLFDNGNDRGENSRAVEYAIDHNTRTMTLVWSYSVDHYQPNRGSARRTAQGNTLINWVEREQGDIEIVSPDGIVLYSITIPVPYASYRASFRG